MIKQNIEARLLLLFWQNERYYLARKPFVIHKTRQIASFAVYVAET